MGLKIYKRGQGAYTRLYTGLVAGAIALLGCWVLYEQLTPVAGVAVETLVPAAVAVVLCFAIYWIVNQPTVADFLISAEGEVKKVSWSSRREIVLSTTLVISVVILLSLVILAADFVFQWVMQEVVGIGIGA